MFSIQARFRALEFPNERKKKLWHSQIMESVWVKANIFLLNFVKAWYFWYHNNNTTSTTTTKIAKKNNHPRINWSDGEMLRKRSSFYWCSWKSYAWNPGFKHFCIGHTTVWKSLQLLWIEGWNFQNFPPVRLQTITKLKVLIFAWKHSVHRHTTQTNKMETLKLSFQRL